MAKPTVKDVRIGHVVGKGNQTGYVTLDPKPDSTQFQVFNTGTNNTEVWPKDEVRPILKSRNSIKKFVGGL